MNLNSGASFPLMQSAAAYLLGNVIYFVPDYNPVVCHSSLLPCSPLPDSPHNTEC